MPITKLGIIFWFLVSIFMGQNFVFWKIKNILKKLKLWKSNNGKVRKLEQLKIPNSKSEKLENFENSWGEKFKNWRRRWYKPFLCGTNRRKRLSDMDVLGNYPMLFPPKPRRQRRFIWLTIEKKNKKNKHLPASLRPL